MMEYLFYSPERRNSEKREGEGTEKEISDAYELAKGFFDQADYVKALEASEKTISDHGMNQLCSVHHQLQGDIFFELAVKANTTDIKCVYLFASVDSYSTSTLLCPDSVSSLYGCARSLVELGDELGTKKFYKKAESKARRGLYSCHCQSTEDLEKKLEALINHATRRMNCNAAVYVPDTSCTQTTEQGKRDPYVDRLKNLWGKLDEKTKRDFLVVDSESLIDYMKDLYGKKVMKHFHKCLCAHEKLRWRWWKCHICPHANFFCFTDCNWHILDNHVHIFQPRITSARPKCVDKVLARMICCGDWEPVDTAEAVKLIMSRIESESGDEFVYVNGWCSDWPVSNDEKRKEILKQFSQLLKSCCSGENDTLSSSLWDWLIDYTEENVELPHVLGIYLDHCGLFKNPQCICFLDLKNLEHLLDYFRELTTNVSVGLVSTAVNRLWDKSLVKERIDLERGTCNMLLDERLLYEGEHHDFDDIATIRTFKFSGIYEHVIPKGDKMVSWILDCPEIDTDFVSRVAEGVHNLEIWLAALRILRCTSRKEVSYYNKRDKLITYDKMLGEAEALCDNEDKRRNADLRSTYARVLGRECAKRVKQNNSTKTCFLNLVRDILQDANSPRFDDLEDKEFIDCISGLSPIVQNDVVKKSLLKLRNSLENKSHLIDTKILLNEGTYKKLHEFSKLSVIENRLVVLPFVKIFLQDKLKSMMKKHNRMTPVAAESSAKKGRV